MIKRYKPGGVAALDGDLPYGPSLYVKQYRYVESISQDILKLRNEH